MSSTEIISARPQRLHNCQKHPRGASTIVDSNGCIVTRGFVVPSGKSSFTAVTEETATASLLHRTMSSPTKSASSNDQQLKTPMASKSLPGLPCRAYQGTVDAEAVAKASCPRVHTRRDLWQSAFPGNCSNRWSDDELADTICVPPLQPVYKASVSFPSLTRMSRNQPTKYTRRTKSENLNFKHFTEQQKNDRSTRGGIEQAGKIKHFEHSVQGAANEPAAKAAASDLPFARGSVAEANSKPKVRVKVTRISYAERRAQNDARNACVKAPEMLLQAMDSAFEDSESAIESDEDDLNHRNEGNGVSELTKAFHLQNFHRSRVSHPTT